MRMSDGRTLKWCLKHDEPVVVYHDESWSCRRQLIVGTSDETECEVVPFNKRPTVARVRKPSEWA